jgi:site-specific recombinase XerD
LTSLSIIYYYDGMNSQANVGCNLYTFEAQFREYLSAVIKMKSTSVKNYVSDFRYFAGWLEQSGIYANDSIELVSRVTPEVVDSYKQYLLSGKLPRQTINRRLSSLRKFFVFAIAQGWTRLNPAKKIHNVRASGQNLSKSHDLTEAKLAMENFETHLFSQNKNISVTKACVDDIKEFFSIINSPKLYENTI